MMTLLMVYFYSADSDLQNDFVKIGGLPSLKKSLSTFIKIQKKLNLQKQFTIDAHEEEDENQKSTDQEET